MFKKIKGYHYEVSNDGQVRNIKTGRILKPNIRRDERLQINLCKNGKEKWFLIHRLVLEAFVGPCPKGMQCCHNNGNPKDNRVVNLRWDTNKNNIKDSIDQGTRFIPKGSKNGNAKLTEEQVREIRAKYVYNSRTASIYVLAKEYGVGKTEINNIINNKLWKHVEEKKNG